MASVPLADERALKHFVRRALDEMTSRCELVANQPGYYGRCPRSAAAVRLEDGFSDVVCAEHAVSAETRGAQVLRP